jgi:formylglycine-generating enzyme required for sulfatase activity
MSGFLPTRSDLIRQREKQEREAATVPPHLPRRRGVTVKAIVLALLLIASLAPALAPRPAGSVTLRPGRRRLVVPPRSKTVTVPAGWFVMGSGAKGVKTATTLCLQDLHPSKPFHYRVCGSHLFKDERPRRRVYVSAFDIDRYEVTRKDYLSCVAAAKCSLPPSPTVKPFLDDRAPMVNVSWREAKRYCRWRGKRLPTEAEWEKAARGPHGKIWPWGDGWAKKMCNHGTLHPVTARFDGDSSDGHYWVAPVGTHLTDRSFYGAFGMAGNVTEWVADRYTITPHETKLDRINPKGPSSGNHRVLKGGSWLGPRFLTRAPSRLSYDPKKRESFIGFRCARDAQ